MANGDGEQTAKSPFVGKIQKPKSIEPDTSFNPNVDNVSPLTKNVPELRGMNEYHFKKKLLEDDKFFEENAQKFFTRATDVRELREAEPEQVAQMYQVFKKNWRKDLVESSYAGQDINETLVDRSITLSDDPTQFNISDYTSVVKGDKKKYQQLGLLDENGSFLYEGNETAFAQHVMSNSKLHKTLQRDRFTQFQEELGKYHNQVDGLDTPEMKTKAWVIYDNKGAEGLTQFINKMQDESADRSFDENEYLRKAQVGDKSLADKYKEFVVGNVKDTKFGDIIAETAYKYEVDPATLSGLVEQESSFNPEAVSSTGAVGLTQLQPATARENGLKVPNELYELDVRRIKSSGQERKEWAKKLRERTKELGIDPESDERYNPQKALQATGQYLAKAGQTLKDKDLTLASYHMGVSGAGKTFEKFQKEWREAVPDSTRDYVKKVRQREAKYANKTDRGLVFRPQKKRDDISKDVPKDLNGYTVDSYNKDGKTKSFDTVLDTFINQRLPKSHAKNFDKSKLKNDGPFSDEYRDLVTSVYEESIKSDGRYNQKTLLDTLIVNSEYKGKMGNGSPYYQIDYNNLNWPQRMAFDALQMNNETRPLFKEMSGNKYRIIPDVKNIALDAVRETRAPFYATETKVTYDKGRAKFEEVPSTDFFSQIQNSLVNLAFGGANFATKYGLDPLFNGLNTMTGGEVDWIREGKEAFEAQSAISLSELSDAETDGWLPNAVEEASPMIWYMAGMFTAGGAIKSGVGKGLQMITRGKQAADGMRLGALLNGSSKWNKIGQKIQTVSNPAIKFYAGGAALEGLTPQQDSFYNVIPQLFGEDQDNPVSKFYNTSSWWTRKAMDVGGSLMLDFGIDTFIGAGKFAKDLTAKQFFGRKKFNSYQFESKVIDGQLRSVPKVVDTPKFTHEVQRFYNEVSNGLANKPIGSVGESMAKDLSDDASVETLHDVAKQYTDKASNLAGGLKSEIREHIQHLQNRFGNGVRLSDDQLDQLVGEQYNQFMATSADNLYKVLKESDDAGLVGRFAQTLEEQMPVTKEFKVAGESIDPSRAPYWRDHKGYNLVVKGNKVYEVDPKFWTNDLAENLRAKDLEASPERIATRKMRKEGIDPDNLNTEQAKRMAELKKEARERIGQTVYVDGKLGYVADYGDEGFTIRTADGDIVRNNLATERSSEELAKAVLNRGESQKLLTAGTPALPPRNQKLLPAGKLRGRYASREERQFIEPVASINRELFTLRNRHENLDQILKKAEDPKLDIDKELSDARIAERSQQRRQLTERINELEAQKAEYERDLARFYQDNPEIQKQRVQEHVIDKRVKPTYNLQNPLDKYLLPEEKFDMAKGINSMYRRAWNNPSTAIKNSAGDYYIRKGDGIFNVQKGRDNRWRVTEEQGRYEVTDDFRTMTNAIEATERLVKSFEEPRIKNMKEKLDDFARKIGDLTRTETKIPFC